MLNAAAHPKPPKESGKRRQRSDVFEPERILSEEEGWLLVRWRGYHPSWEAWRIPGMGNPGDPVDTWEKLTAAWKRTEVYAVWIT